MGIRELYYNRTVGRRNMTESNILFKDFVDDYISKTTEYKTAEELLKSKTKVSFPVLLSPNFKRLKFSNQFTKNRSWISTPQIL